jgi:hypothetical protein
MSVHKSAPKPNQSNYSERVAENVRTVANATIPAMWQDPVTNNKVFNQAYIDSLIDELEAKLPEKDNNDWSKIPHELGNTFGEGFDSAVKEVKKILEDYR